MLWEWLPLIILSPDVIFINATNFVGVAAAVAVCERDRQTDRQSEPWSIYVWSTAFRSWPSPSPILKQDLSSCFFAMYSKPTLLQALGQPSCRGLPSPPRKVMGLQILTTVARLLDFNSDPEVELGTSDLQNTELSDDSKTWFLHSRKLKCSEKENKHG